MSSKLAFGGITKFFFQNLTFGNRVFQNHRRSDLAKPRQTDTARSCLLWNNQWCYKQFSEQHCLEPFFLKTIMRVCFCVITKRFSKLDIWRWGVVEPSEGVTLPSRIRQTPNQVSRSDLLFNSQWFWKPFSNHQGCSFWETFHQTLRLVPSPKDIPSFLTIGDRFAETDGKERPCQIISKRQFPQLSGFTTKCTNDENLGGMYF